MQFQPDEWNKGESNGDNSPMTQKNINSLHE